jgi:hypothetical protein
MKRNFVLIGMRKINRHAGLMQLLILDVRRQDIFLALRAAVFLFSTRSTATLSTTEISVVSSKYPAW